MSRPANRVVERVVDSNEEGECIIRAWLTYVAINESGILVIVYEL
ncbi:hypothetical protein [Alkalihalobacillus hemicellulosilyticus]|nr:hypothetical protein [Halalkalibacter hemicellulosilyticus]